MEVSVSRSKLLAVLMLCFALPVGIAACGGGGGGGGGEEDAIATAIEDSATSTDPADCARYQTDNFLEQLEFPDAGQTALESCEQDAPDPAGNPDSVAVSDISVDGDTATAAAAFSGGGFDGTTFDLALVKEGDQWKLDAVTDIPVFNVEAFNQSLTEQLASDPSIPPETAACVTDAFATAGEEEIKRIILEGDDEAFFAIFTPCV
jgi:hypothetical protein